MDDSYKHGSGLSICTDSYSEQEILILVNVLNNKFNIDCNMMNRKIDQYRIYVKVKSLNHLRNLVLPYFVPSMLYKLQL